MTTLALLLLAASNQVVLVDEEVVVEAGKVKAVHVDLRQRPAVVETTFEVLRGEPVEVSLIGGEGRGRRYLRRVSDRSSGTIRYAARKLGPYQLVLDARGVDQGRTTIRLRIALAFDSAGLLQPGSLSPQRRSAVVALSVLFFLLVVAYTGRRLKAAIAKRRNDEQPPLF